MWFNEIEPHLYKIFEEMCYIKAPMCQQNVGALSDRLSGMLCHIYNRTFYIFKFSTLIKNKSSSCTLGRHVIFIIILYKYINVFVLMY